jgi:hypothetical protein
MPYKFTFDLSSIPRFFFVEITKIGYERDMHRKVGKAIQEIIKKFRIQEATGLNLTEGKERIHTDRKEGPVSASLFPKIHGQPMQGKLQPWYSILHMCSLLLRLPRQQSYAFRRRERL